MAALASAYGFLAATPALLDLAEARRVPRALAVVLPVAVCALSPALVPFVSARAGGVRGRGRLEGPTRARRAALPPRS